MKILTLFTIAIVLAGNVFPQVKEVNDNAVVETVSRNNKAFLEALLVDFNEKKYTSYLHPEQFACSNTADEDLYFDSRKKLRKGLKQITDLVEDKFEYVEKLGDAIKSAEAHDSFGFKSLSHENSKLFTLYQFGVKEVEGLCVVPELTLKEKKLNHKEFYFSQFLLEQRGYGFAGRIFWIKQGKSWKIVSFGIETP